MKYSPPLDIEQCETEGMHNDNVVNEFYVHGSVHRLSILIIVQRDATQISLFIILQVHSTCFGGQLRPSSGVHKTVTTASGSGHILVQLPPSNVAKLTWPLDTRNM